MTESNLIGLGIWLVFFAVWFAAGLLSAIAAFFVAVVCAIFVFRAVTGRDPRREGKDE